MPDNTYDDALDRAGQLLGQLLSLPLGPGEPESGNEFRRVATLHTSGDARPEPTSSTLTRAV